MVKGAGIEYGASFLHIILQFVGLFVFRKKLPRVTSNFFSLFSKATKCAHFEGRKIVIWQLVFKVPESDTLGLLWWWWRCGALLMGNSEQLECSMSSGLQVCSLFSLDQFPTTRLLLWKARGHKKDFLKSSNLSYLHQALANSTEIMKNICDREVGLMFYSTSLLDEGKGSVAVSNCPLLFLPTSFQTNGCCTMEPDYDVLASSKKEEEIAEAFTIYGWWWW